MVWLGSGRVTSHSSGRANRRGRRSLLGRQPGGREGPDEQQESQYEPGHVILPNAERGMLRRARGTTLGSDDPAGQSHDHAMVITSAIVSFPTTTHRSAPARGELS
jgi:hypothetical protein